MRGMIQCHQHQDPGEQHANRQNERARHYEYQYTEPMCKYLQKNKRNVIMSGILKDNFRSYGKTKPQKPTVQLRTRQ